MTSSDPHSAPRRPAGRARAALRSLSPSAIAVTFALVFGGAGFADAANGGNFLLGKANTETATATLSNTKGIPLSLSAPAHKAPLTVNQQTMVKNLNAQFTGGFTASELETTGREDVTGPGTSAPVDSTGEVVATTGPLPAGTYYITATALVHVAAGDGDGFCYIRKTPQNTNLNEGGATQEGDIQAAETAAATIPAGDAFEEVCFTGGLNGSDAFDAGIIAIRIKHQA